MVAVHLRNRSTTRVSDPTVHRVHRLIDSDCAGTPPVGGRFEHFIRVPTMVELFSDNIDALRAIHSGRLTPKVWQAKGVPWRLTYRKRAKLPWFLVVQCSYCRQYGITGLKTKIPAGQRFRCQQWRWEVGSGERKCGHLVSFVPVRDMGERFGLSPGQANRLRNEWLEKYASGRERRVGIRRTKRLQ